MVLSKRVRPTWLFTICKKKQTNNLHMLVITLPFQKPSSTSQFSLVMRINLTLKEVCLRQKLRLELLIFHMNTRLSARKFQMSPGLILGNTWRLKWWWLAERFLSLLMESLRWLSFLMSIWWEGRGQRSLSPIIVMKNRDLWWKLSKVFSKEQRYTIHSINATEHTLWTMGWFQKTIVSTRWCSNQTWNKMPLYSFKS